jgi:hypothetical protein
MGFELDISLTKEVRTMSTHTLSVIAIVLSVVAIGLVVFRR